MRAFELIVSEIASAGGLVRMACAGPDPGAAPGQACLALADRPEQPWLRLPLYLAAREAGAEFFVPVTHPYARLAPGDRLDVIGPVGRGFRLPEGAANVLVVAGSLERLLPTIDQALRQGLAITVLTPRSADLLPTDVEVHRAPLSADLAAWADVVLLDVADPKARAKHIRSLVPPRAEQFVQALFQAPMPCGVGACQACWVEVGSVKRLCCVEGPVFTV
jgi:dihydroorotate dehydrogenase electron transfer subunit